MEKKNFNIVVEEAIHIPKISKKLTDLAKKGNSGFVLLQHREGPCIIRGISQPLLGKFNSNLGYSTLKGLPEIRREDGGLTWIHPRQGSFCLNQYGDFSYRNKSFQHLSNKNNNNLWNFYLSGTFPRPDSMPFIYKQGDPDIYTSNENQIIGTSMAEHVRRACFYEGGKDKLDVMLESIMKSDLMLEGGDQIQLVIDSYNPFPKGTHEKLISQYQLGEEILSSDFVEGVDDSRIIKLQEDISEKRKLRGYCIGGIYPGLK